ncbi:MAG TPA: alpha/beta fold hydrolase [Geothrix sp.]
MNQRAALPYKFRALRLGFRVLRAASPSLALRWAERLFCTPRRHREPEPELAALRRGRAFHFQSNGLRLQAHAWGEGPAVLLLHGWEGRGAQFHAFIDPLVEAGFSAISFDQAGHGRSQGRQAGPLIWAQAVEALIDEIGPIHGIVAHSLGAAGAAIAMDRGAYVPLAVFIAPPAEPDPFYGGLLSALGLPEKEHPAAFEAFAARLGVPWNRVRLRSLAPRLSAPLLVIHDRGDREVPWSSGAAIASAWPAARLHSTEGLGHRRILRDAAVVERSVAFLSQGANAAILPFHGDGPHALEWHLFRRDLRTA